MSGIDVIICTYNRSDAIAGLVRALEAQARESDRIIIVWQGQLRPPLGFSERAMLVRSNPPSLPIARNAGMRSGTNDIVLYIDDDVEVADGLLEGHRGCYNDSSIGAVAGYVDDLLFSHDKRMPPSQFDFRTGECIQNFSVDKSGDSLSVMGANMSFRRSVLESIGGFDTRFSRNALWEDVDCAFRVRSKGFRIRFCRDAALTHFRSERGGCRNDHGAQYVYHQFANTTYFAGKFAPRKHIWSWVRFWWYRLEFLSRTGDRSGRAHDPYLVAAGCAGAFSGILRYTLARLLMSPQTASVDRSRVSATGSGSIV